MIVDTSALLAFFNAAEPAHNRVSEIVQDADNLVVSPYVVAELDYLLATRVSVLAETAALRELAGGAYVLAEFGQNDVLIATQVIERYQDQSIGIADASIVVLAERYNTSSVLTLDRRHFEVIRPLQGGTFEVFPEA